MSVSLRQILLFEAIARHGNVTLAARECGLSQPAATQALAQIQLKLDVCLAERRARGIALTASGIEMRSRIEPSLTRLREALRKIGVASPDTVAWHISFATLRNLGAMRLHGGLDAALKVASGTRRAILRSVQILEKRIESPLIERDGHITKLTGAGHILAEMTSGLPDELEWIFDRLKQATAARQSLIVGVASDPGTAGLTSAVKQHLLLHPEIGLEIVELDQSDLIKRLLREEVDLAIGHVPLAEQAGARWSVLRKSRFRVVARKNHPLTKLSRASLRELARQVWMFGAKGTQRRAATDVLFADQTLPQCALVTAAAPLMAQVMVDTDMICLMTDRELAVRSDVLEAIEHEMPAITVTKGYAIRSDWQPLPQQTAFLEALEATFNE